MINLSDILISGYYGFKNSGDDALLLAILHDLKEQKPDIKTVVLSKSPKETSRLYNVKAVDRLNPFSVIFNMMKTKMLISGGGTLIQDRTSTKSLMYYLFIIRCAHFFGKKIMLYANGIGPLVNEKNRRVTAKTLNMADVITLRDADSEKELRSLGVDEPVIKVTADPAFNLECKKAEKKEKKACISVRSWNGVGNDFTDVVAKAADYLIDRYGYKVVFLPMQPAKDLIISGEIMGRMKNKSVCVKDNLSVEKMLSAVSETDLCIGMRLHSLIYAASNALPIIGLVYDPKIAGFMDYIGQNMYIDTKTVTFEDLKEMIDKCEENRDEIIKMLEAKLAELKEKAKYNAVCAVELLEGGTVS